MAERPDRRAFRQPPSATENAGTKARRALFPKERPQPALGVRGAWITFPGIKEDPSMNRLLIGILDLLNKLLAVVLVISSTISGYYGQFGTFGVVVDDPLHRALATVIGFVIGVVLAALVSGLLATIINISREMTTIRELLRERRVVTPVVAP
jgi:hypothetical protein